jgi:uncharacterized protein (DUF1810 family)
VDVPTPSRLLPQAHTHSLSVSLSRTLICFSVPLIALQQSPTKKANTFDALEEAHAYLQQHDAKTAAQQRNAQWEQMENELKLLRAEVRLLKEENQLLKKTLHLRTHSSFSQPC